MSRIVTALFRNRAQAQQGLQALISMGIAQSRVTTIGFQEPREVSSISGFRTLDIPDDSRNALDGLGLPAADRRLFEQGLRRGCALIAARVERDHVDEAVQVLSVFDVVDLDRDSREWAEDSGSAEERGTAGGPLAAGLTGGNAEGLTNTGALPGMGGLTDDGSALGTADLRTDEAARSMGGAGTTRPTGEHGRNGRENRPGVVELSGTSATPAPDAGPMQRDMNRSGPIWSYGTD